MPHPLVRGVTVKKLFGRYNYTLEFANKERPGNRLVLLHGDNGSGKTTLLRLIWHTLSAAESSGHRTFLSTTPFESFVVHLRGGQSILTQKSNGLVGSFTSILRRPGKDDVVATFEADENLRVRKSSPALLPPRSYTLNTFTHPSQVERLELDWEKIEAGQHRELLNNRAKADFFAFLTSVAEDPLYLADDRSLYSDDDDIRRTRMMVSRRDENERDTPSVLASLVFQELRVTLQRVNEYLTRLTFGGQDVGSANSNSVYESLLRQLAIQEPADGSRPPRSDDASFALIEDIGARSLDFARFGLAPRFDAKLFQDLLGAIQDNGRAEIARHILGPYLSGLRARYDALENAKDVISTFIATVNRFLRSKQVSFSPYEGIRIIAEGNEALAVESLSSGERQLLMLLCTTLLARDEMQLFIIDEPELSLGVEWQRAIMPALLNLTAGTQVQFLIATHSIEIISGSPDSLVLLEHEA